MRMNRRPNDLLNAASASSAGSGLNSIPATTYTANAMLIKPATAQRNWDVSLNANADTIDGMSTIGQLLVTPTEIPSASLNIRITSGSYQKGDGTVGSYAGSASYALPASSSVAVWLSDGGVLNTSSVFPTTACVQLAQVTTGVSTIQSIVDQRVGPRTAGSGLGFVLKAGDTMSGALSIVSVSSGTTVFKADPTVPGIGFFGTAPATQAPVIAALTNSSTGIATSAIVDVGPSFSQTNLDNNFATVTLTLNALIAALKRHGLMSS